MSSATSPALGVGTRVWLGTGVHEQACTWKAGGFPSLSASPSSLHLHPCARPLSLPILIFILDVHMCTGAMWMYRDTHVGTGAVRVQEDTRLCPGALHVCRDTRVHRGSACARTHICTCAAQSLSLSLSCGCLCPGGCPFLGVFLPRCPPRGVLKSIPVPTGMLCRSRRGWNVGGCSLPSSLASTWDPWQRRWPLAHKVGAVGRVVLGGIYRGMGIGLGGR